MASYEELRDYFDRIGPQHITKYSPEWNDEFNHWVGTIMEENGFSNWDDMPFELVEQYDYEPPAPTDTVPLEQGLLNQALPGLLNDVNADAGRRTIADNLAAQATQGANAAATALGRTQGGGFDGRTYLAQNPDVASEYERLGGQQGTGQTIDQFAEQHYLSFGQREGRQPAYTMSPQLAQDMDNANRTTQGNIAALQTATDSMVQNLSGALGERAAALQQQIAALNSNLDTLDATQRKALTDQIAAMTGNLEQSIATQRQALEQQVAALGNAAGAEAQAKRAALQGEIAALNAAQGPVNEARLNAAELQATAVNTGLQRTQDQMTADAARAGFVGGSTVQDAALARATVDARQRAAEAVGGARVMNASDTRDIAARGATGERSIADALASAQREIAGLGATGNFGLTSNLAQGRQQIGDYGATGTASITNNTAVNRAGIGNYGADTTFQDRVFGADQKRSLLDSLAAGTANTTITGNNAKAAYQDADFNRRVSSGLALSAIPQQLTSSLTGLDNYANSGLGRTLNTLNWWGTNQSQAPTPGYNPVQPSNSGNDLANLGAGLASLGLNYGQANSWWQTPKPKAGTVDTNEPGS